MKSCSQCHTSFPPRVTHCDIDGTPLDSAAQTGPFKPGATTRDLLVGKILDNRFQILEKLGEGGTGVVYRARQVSLGRMVALKLLSPAVVSDSSWIKRFEVAARGVAALNHPNHIRVYDLGQTKEGYVYLAMELLRGRDLREELDAVGKIPPERALRIATQAARAVGDAHAHGILHRDIKPENVFLCEDEGWGEYVKVLESTMTKVDSPDAPVTRVGMVLGTPCYMSPEQAQGLPKLGP
jgi:serine/threonine-protein kinase